MSTGAAHPESPRAPGAGDVRRVLVLADAARSGVPALLRELEPWLAERVDDVRIEPDGRSFCEALERGEGGAVPDVDLVVVIGGDGALLGAVRAFSARPVPTFGINFGHVGFLATTPASRWREVLADVLEGRGVIEPRMRLAAEVSAGGERIASVALNDVVLQRASTEGLLTISLWVERDWVTTYRADGLILATPTGSTAYSLSAGGPVLAPSMGGIIATPLGAQGLSHRPIVLHPDSNLAVVIEGARSDAALVIDGQSTFTISPGDTVQLAKHPVPWPLLVMPGLDPYRRLRSRLGWGTGEPGEQRQAPW